jgi:uracil-DNA glycosylase family 4
MSAWKDHFDATVAGCRLCPRLVTWREQVARDKKREFRDWEYWGRAVPSFGLPDARLLIIGLAPAAHGANRTGRMFTGDQSGRWLYRALHKAGFANQPTWERKDDGLQLRDCYITAVCHCAPPDNKPLPAEMINCSRYLNEELERLRRAQVVICLGRIAFAAYHKARGISPLPAFGHGEVHGTDPVAIASYHPSQQNTHTGKLTEPMFDAVFARAASLLASAKSG